MEYEDEGGGEEGIEKVERRVGLDSVNVNAKTEGFEGELDDKNVRVRGKDPYFSRSANS